MTAMPPQDRNGESETAFRLLKHIRKLLKDKNLSPEWQRWVVGSLASTEQPPSAAEPAKR